MQDLGTLGSWRSEAYAINDARMVVGCSYTTAGEEHAFVWTPAGGMQDMGTLGGARSCAHSINNAGVAVGISWTADGDRAFRWTAENGMESMYARDGGPHTAYDINAHGGVLGALILRTPTYALLDAGGRGIRPLIFNDLAVSLSTIDDLENIAGGISDGRFHAALLRKRRSE